VRSTICGTGSGPATLHLLSEDGVYLARVAFHVAWRDFTLEDGVVYALTRNPDTDLPHPNIPWHHGDRRLSLVGAVPPSPTTITGTSMTHTKRPAGATPADRDAPRPDRVLRRFLPLPCAVLALGLPAALAAQSESPPVPALRAGSGAAEVRLDGLLDEPVWTAADSIADLIEVEPVAGARPSGRTVVRVLASADAVIVGIVAYDPDPAGVVSYAKARDANLEHEDHVRLLFDTFLDHRSGYVFAVNPAGARYDALVSHRGESQDSNWDAIWEAATARTPEGWSAEIRIPIKSLAFAAGLDRWGFNIERRVQRLQETSRWATPSQDARVTQPSLAGTITGLPPFSLGLGLTVRPALTGGGSKQGPGLPIDRSLEPSLDASQRLGPNLLATGTVNTDFAETEVDTRRTNLTRFPLFFPEKRTFFLEGTDIFDFGLGTGTDVMPFYSRRIGLVSGREVPLNVGGKLSGRVGGTNIGALAARTGAEDSVAPATNLAVVRVRQNVLRESSAGVIATAGDPLGRSGSWLAGTDFTYQTSRFAGDKNFLVGVWGLAMGRDSLVGDRTAAGILLDYPNDLWDVAVSYKRIGDGFDPSLGFVPRTGVHMISLNATYAPRPRWQLVRQMFHEFRASGVTDLDGNWESYRVFMAPVNWRLESGDRFELNVAPEGQRLVEPFELAGDAVIPAGSYHFTRFRLEVESASKRPLGGQVTWWFGGFYSGTLHQIELEGSWRPSGTFAVEVNAERDIGRLPEGNFTTDLLGTRVQVNFSPDLTLSSFVQWDTESRLLGSNTRLRWTFDPLGDVFLVYNHNLADRTPGGLGFASNELLAKVQYAVRF